MRRYDASVPKGHKPGTAICILCRVVRRTWRQLLRQTCAAVDELERCDAAESLRRRLAALGLHAERTDRTSPTLAGRNSIRLQQVAATCKPHVGHAAIRNLYHIVTHALHFSGKSGGPGFGLGVRRDGRTVGLEYGHKLRTGNGIAVYGPDLYLQIDIQGRKLLGRRIDPENNRIITLGLIVRRIFRAESNSFCRRNSYPSAEHVSRSFFTFPDTAERQSRSRRIIRCIPRYTTDIYSQIRDKEIGIVSGFLRNYGQYILNRSVSAFSCYFILHQIIADDQLALVIDLSSRTLGRHDLAFAVDVGSLDNQRVGEVSGSSSIKIFAKPVPLAALSWSADILLP